MDAFSLLFAFFFESRKTCLRTERHVDLISISRIVSLATTITRANNGGQLDCLYANHFADSLLSPVKSRRMAVGCAPSHYEEAA